MLTEVKVRGVFTLEHWRAGKLIGTKKIIPNLVLTAGLDAMNNIMFHGTTQITTWYLGLIDNAGFSAIAAGDTPASHAGWTELTDYDEATRVAWTEGASASGIITSSAVSVFTISATKTIKGLFLTSLNTKGGTTGTMWCATAFSTAQPAVDDDVIKLSYSVELSP